MKKILDVCCGPKMFWFDKKHPDAVFMDIRKESFVACDGRSIKIDPDILGDFRNIPFPDKHFKLVVFDPPHLNKLGKNSWTAQKYGKLSPTWGTDLKQGYDDIHPFREYLRLMVKAGVKILGGIR